MTVVSFTPRIPRTAAKHRLAARYASEYHGASGYESGWAGLHFAASELPAAVSTCDARFSLLGNTICSGGDR
jgi:hypothetical protein